jgi:hypothetical protein
MRKLKTILVASVVAASLYASAGTAWARIDSGQRGTAWTDANGTGVWGEPSGTSWEISSSSLDF